jgi:hypothetical protein
MTNPANLDRPHPVSARPGWVDLLDTLAAAGAQAGRAAADWWAQDTVGGRATGNTIAAAARRVLAGLDDGDPAILDTLPTPPADDEHWYDQAAPADAPELAALTAADWDAVVDAYRDGFQAAVTDAVTAHCRAAASPTGDGRGLSHLHPDRVMHPDRVRIGSVGVFSGDWAWTIRADGTDRIAVGYVGTLIDTWNGWAVFSCTRPVAEAIVADQHHHRRDHRDALRAEGVPESDLDARVDAELTNLWFDGDVIVADQRAQYDDPEAIDHLRPDPAGRYVVMGWNWCWGPVDPNLCDRIIGDLPEPDGP